MENNKLNLDLQFFAEDAADTDKEEKEVKTYTQEEVLSLIQSEADKRVSQALATQQKKYEQKMSLSQLDENSREKAEKDIRIQELEEKLKEFNIMQTKQEVTKVLSERGLDSRFADIINIGEDVQEAQTKIETLDKLFKACVEKEVKTRIGTTSPKGGFVQTTGLTKEQFKNMSLVEQNKLYEQDKDLYMSLCK